ncbi:DUF3179 domain-containing protein [Methylomarinum sp. Ch1-1]|uniref:DUF3179 domain-containing protein n=1 Tax=Methylomarinum roseum TaxID=3067653 RepID=A0AAU7NQY7_9GAMM|nr:DUF3179 domain-containing protein [Methylomarinum sp. Ch1-1]MDP4520687.1 DUF3179 domain-containing protein [Methylomarinum sp. Ch1-1]
MKLLKPFTMLYLLLWLSGCSAQSKNGFDLTGALVPADHILSGGPVKDGIPAIDNPTFIEPSQADYLKESSPVLGMTYHGEARAYPINILNWHEIVNDRFGDEPVVITFCPLCGSGMAFSARIDGEPHTFGVSGLLYNSDVLLYDRQTESLWSQLMTQAVSGPHKGKQLHPLPVLHTTWQDWLSRHPDTRVLSTDTGYRRAYRHSPYQAYLDSPRLMFPVVTAVSKRYHPKEAVLGVEIKGVYKAYPFIELEQSPSKFSDSVGGHEIIIRYDSEHRIAEAFDASGKPLPAVRTFWFAWYSFHLDTAVYVAPKKSSALILRSSR